MAWQVRNPSEEKELLNLISDNLKESCYIKKQSTDCDLLGRFTEMVSKDVGKAAALYRSNCDDNHSGTSCLKYAQCAAFGRGVPTDPTKAFEYTQKGCVLNEAESCRMAGMACIPDVAVYRTLYVKTDYMAGLEYFKRGCELRDRDSCYMAGGLYLNGVHPFIEPDKFAAFNYDFKACLLGSDVACANLNGAFQPVSRTQCSKNGLQWRMEQLKKSILAKHSAS